MSFEDTKIDIAGALNISIAGALLGGLPLYANLTSGLCLFWGVINATGKNRLL